MMISVFSRLENGEERGKCAGYAFSNRLFSEKNGGIVTAWRRLFCCGDCRAKT